MQKIYGLKECGSGWSSLGSDTRESNGLYVGMFFFKYGVGFLGSDQDLVFNQGSDTVDPNPDPKSYEKNNTQIFG